MSRNKEWFIVTDECAFSDREQELVRAGHYKHIWPEFVRIEINHDGFVLPRNYTTEVIMSKINSGIYLPGHLKTSSMSPIFVINILKAVLDGTDADVIALSTSEYISATSANNMAFAVSCLKDEYGDRIHYVDSRSTSHGQMLLLELLNEFSPTEHYGPIDYLQNDLIPHLAHRFTEPDLTFAIESGRYSGLVKGAAKFTANQLKARKIMPYMTLPVDDKLQPDFLRLHHYRKMVSIWVEEFKLTSADKRVIVEYAGEPMREKAEFLAEQLRQAGALVRVELLPPPICVHTGNVVAWHNLVNFNR